jgi:hypothetical protein
MSSLVGALVIANALGDAEEFGRATGALLERRSEIVA